MFFSSTSLIIIICQWRLVEEHRDDELIKKTEENLIEICLNSARHVFYEKKVIKIV